MKATDPNHPIWDVAELLAAVLIVGIVLWHNASNFDRTETISIAQIGTLLAVVLSARGGARLLVKKGQQWR